jgi:hypothetical protein
MVRVQSLGLGVIVLRIKIKGFGFIVSGLGLRA